MLRWIKGKGSHYILSRYASYPFFHPYPSTYYNFIHLKACLDHVLISMNVSFGVTTARETKNVKILMALSIVNALPVLFKITMMCPIMPKHAWIMTNAVTENMNVIQMELARTRLVLMHVNVIVDFLVMVMNVLILMNVQGTATNATPSPIASTLKLVTVSSTSLSSDWLILGFF